MAIIGETLAVPEYGFTRYEFIDKDDLTLNNEYFCGITASIIQDDNGLLAVGTSNGGEILVKIKNTYGFRLLVCLPSSTNANTLYTNNMAVEIDGVKHTFDLTSNRNATIIDNCLAVDIKNLSTNSHIVKIYADGNNNNTQMINVQAIDIDAKGVVGFTRTMASMFEGCTNLKKDIIIPKNADMVENMFKNCTSMTHVRSNWDETYDDSGIITEDCYNGCTAITHIDGKALILNEYANGLDDIPPNWGGYGYTKEYTGVYRIEILSPNYTFSFASDGLLDNGYINWGDGTITQNEYSHTYVNAGVYTIKGKVHSTYETVTDSMKLCLKEIIQYPIYGNLYAAFIGCTALISANISGNKYFEVAKGRAGVFNGCTNLERVIALDTKLEKEVNHTLAFQGCKKLREIIGVEDFIYNTVNLMNCFSSCSSLSNFTLSEDALKNCTSLYQAFYGCASLTESPIKTFVSNSGSLSIGRVFMGCTNITDISGVTFGENITNADDWYPPNLTTANNVTIKNDVVGFHRNSTLQYCNNLRSYYAKSFIGCTALVELKNLLIRSEDGTVISAYGANAYRTCSKLKIIKFDPNCKVKYTTCDFMFIENPLLEEVDFGGGVTLEPTQNGDSVFGSAIKTIKNMKVGGISTGVRFGGYSTEDYGNNFANLEYLDCTIMTQEASKFFKGSGIKDVSNVKFDISIEDLSESFMNNRLLLQDVEVQSHIRNCSSMFKNCEALTHIHSNWNKSYDGGIIISTDCYSGCTAITHIDNKNVIAYKGDNALDYIPTEWGGNGLIDDGTISILEVTIPSDNYSLKLFPWNYAFSRRQGRDVNDWTKISLDNRINWGDGESYKNDNNDGSASFPTHTYARAGVYYIKGHFGRFGAEVTPSSDTYDFNTNARYQITKVLKWAYLGRNDATNVYRETNLGYSFTGLNNVKSISGLKVTNQITNLSGLCQDCNSLISIDFSDCDTSGVTSMEYMFNRCSSLTSVDLSGFDTRNVTTMQYMFYNCSSLTSLNLSSFDTSNVTTMLNMFCNCSSLASLDLSGCDTSNVTIMQNMFYNCSSLTSLNLSGFDTRNVTTMLNMFNGCSSLTSLDLSTWDTSNVKEMSYIFTNCKALTNINVSGWNLSKVKSLSSVFQDCISLKNLDLSSWNVSSVTNFASVFYGCTALETLNISTWDMSNAEGEYNTRWMFDKCDSLKSNPYTGIANGHGAISSIKLTSTALPTELDFGGFTFGEKNGSMWEVQVPNHTTRVTGLRTAPICKIIFQHLNNLEYLDAYNIGIEREDFGGLPPFYYGGFNNIPNGGVTILFIGDYTRADAINFFLRRGPGEQGALTAKLSAESLVSLISCLHDFASEGQTGGTIYFRPEAIARLTSAQLAVATGKGWTIVAAN